MDAVAVAAVLVVVVGAAVVLVVEVVEVPLEPGLCRNSFAERTPSLSPACQKSFATSPRYFYLGSMPNRISLFLTTATFGIICFIFTLLKAMTGFLGHPPRRVAGSIPWISFNSSFDQEHPSPSFSLSHNGS